MAAIHQALSILTVLTSMLAQLCIGTKSCTIWSSYGSVVNLESNFTVYCTFNLNCKRSIYVNNPVTPEPHVKLNSTTIYLNVTNITENTTYSCDCNSYLDPCGLDIITGYPPDRPENIKCIQYVEERLVECTWNRGRNTYIMNSSKLGVRTISGNHTAGERMFYTGSSKGSEWLTATFNVTSSIKAISVQATTENKLGTAESRILNFTLADIAMLRPPVLTNDNCTSRSCEIKLIPPQQNKQIEYRTGQQDWMLYQESGGVIRSLEPHTRYCFRARIKCRTGLWSQWSAIISALTQEECPDQALDVWFSKSNTEHMTVFWRKLNESNARGQIKKYIVTVNNSNTVLEKAIGPDAHCYVVESCSTNCQVTVYAQNSKGSSPPATIPMHNTHEQAYLFSVKPLEAVHAVAGNDSITISWTKPAFLPTGYLVEWYPRGQMLDTLQWVRIAGNESRAVITNIEQFECYEGAVHVFNGRSFGKAGFMGVSTLELAPDVGPVFSHHLMGNKINVSWTEVPKGQRRGCIIQYTIYIKVKQSTNSYNRSASEGSYITEDLPPDQYSLWMTAWTSQGESPGSEIEKVLIKNASQNNELMLVMLMLLCSLLCCLCVMFHCKRLCMIVHCVMPDVIDPANSKWARECPNGEGKMNLEIKLIDSTSKEEDEPDIADVEELAEKFFQTSRRGKFISGVSSNFPQVSLSTETGPVTRLNSQTSYIKSLSHDSDSSENTHSSQETSTTVDYISTYEPENEMRDEEDEEEDLLSFLPSRNVCMDSVVFGGPLTLDAVKLDCSVCWENG